MGLGYREQPCIYSETDPCWEDCDNKYCILHSKNNKEEHDEETEEDC